MTSLDQLTIKRGSNYILTVEGISLSSTFANQTIGYQMAMCANPRGI